MAISEGERAELAERIRHQRERVFGTKKAAYQRANVNAGTWDRAEEGEPIRGDRLRSIVRTLWPHTEGDWTLIDQPIDSPEGPTYEELVARIARLEAWATRHGGSLGDHPPQEPTQPDESSENPGASA